jgi:23S rRNA pseudouridine2605 synthase
MPPQRLQKILAAAGVASRRGSEELIVAGRVKVDGRQAVIGEQVDAETAEIEVDGRAILRPSGGHTHLVLHKPAGVTSTVRDRHAARTVLDLVPPSMRPAAGRLFPVGRLDQDSEGLLLLTDDGSWAERVLHPRFGIEREYALGLRSELTVEQRRALEAGIELPEGQATLYHLRPATPIETRRLVALLQPSAPPLAWYRASLRQGWKRQLRRMFGAVEMPVERLIRVRVGPIRLDELPSGEVRRLTPAQVRSLPGTPSTD